MGSLYEWICFEYHLLVGNCFMGHHSMTHSYQTVFYYLHVQSICLSIPPTSSASSIFSMQKMHNNNKKKKFSLLICQMWSQTLSNLVNGKNRQNIWIAFWYLHRINIILYFLNHFVIWMTYDFIFQHLFVQFVLFSVTF